MTKRKVIIALCSTCLVIGLPTLFYAPSGSWLGRIGIALIGMSGGLLLQIIANRYGHIKLF